MGTADEYVSNGEIARQLTALTVEVRELRRELVRRDVYEAERRADAAVVDGLRADMEAMAARVDRAEEDRRSTRRGATLAVLAAVLSLGVQLVVTLVG